MKRLALVALLPGLLAACGGTGSGSVSIIGVDPKAELTIDVSGLPGGAAADLTVSSAKGRLQLTGPAVLRDLPLGTYTVDAQTVMADGAPYLATVTPASSTFTERTLRATVKVQYDLPLVGQLTLNVAGVPDGGTTTTLHLNGPNGFQKSLPGLATQTLMDLAPGEYTLRADAIRVENFTYPAAIQPARLTVERGRTSVGNVSFARDPRYGNLGVRVLGLPEGVTGEVTAAMTGGAPRSITGSGVLTDLLAGTYTVTGADVRAGGMTYRAPSGAVGVQGAQTAFTDVTYAPVTGRLRVMVNSPVAVPVGALHVAHAGAPGVSITETTLLDDVTPGGYTLKALPFETDQWIYVPVMTQASADVSAGNTAGLTVTYVPQTTHIGGDFTPPAVTLDNVEDGTLRGMASDAEGPVTVAVFVGSVLLGEVTPVNGRWSLAWPVSEPGTFEVTAEATDAAQNSSRVTGTFTR